MSDSIKIIRTIFCSAQSQPTQKSVPDQHKRRTRYEDEEDGIFVAKSYYFYNYKSFTPIKPW